MNRTKQPVKVYEREGADGLITFYHHITLHGSRSRERLEVLGRHRKNSRSYLKAKRNAEEAALVRSADIFRGEFGMVENRSAVPFMKFVEEHCAGKAREEMRVKVAREFWQKTTLAQVTPRKVEEYKRALMSRYADKTAFALFAITCKAVLRHCHEEGYIRTDPARRVSNPPNVARTKSPLLTTEEVQKWLNWTPRMRTIRCDEVEMDIIHRASCFMLFTGFLWAETKELTHADIADGYVEIVRCKNRRKAHAKSFCIALSEEARRYAGKGEAGELLFPCGTSQRYMIAGLRFIARDLGISKQVNIRTFRHTLLTQMALNGAGAHAIQSVAGHSRITMSQEYVRRTEQLQIQHLTNVYRR